MLMALAHERKDVDRERFSQNLKKTSLTQANQWTAQTAMRSDVEDLRTLEAGMEKDPMFRDLLGAIPDDADSGTGTVVFGSAHF